MSQTATYCNCVKSDCGEFCQCQCHMKCTMEEINLSEYQKRAWDYLLDRVHDKLPLYMDDISMLLLNEAGVRKFTLWIINLGYKSEKHASRFTYGLKKQCL